MFALLYVHPYNLFVFDTITYQIAAEKLLSSQSSTKPRSTTTTASSTSTTSIVQLSSSSHVSSVNRKQDRLTQYNHLGVFNHNHQVLKHNQNNNDRGDVKGGGIESRPTRMILQVCYELNALLNPPTTIPTHGPMSERNSPSSNVVAVASSSVSSSSSSHPASLTPLQASQDTILKILTTLCTILRSEGSALLLCNTPPGTSTPNIDENATHAGRECVYTTSSLRVRHLIPSSIHLLDHSNVHSHDSSLALRYAPPMLRISILSGHISRDGSGLAWNTRV